MPIILKMPIIITIIIIVTNYNKNVNNNNNNNSNDTHAATNFQELLKDFLIWFLVR